MTELYQWLRKQEETKGEPYWTYDTRFFELEVARAWGLTRPGDWDSLSQADKEEMAAHYRTRRKMAAWESHLEEKRIEAARREAERKK